MQRRKYSQEFKREAVALTHQPGVTIKQVSDEIGTNSNMLSRWRHEIKGHGSKAFIGQGHARDEEMAALKRELNRVKKEQTLLMLRPHESKPASV